MGHTEIVQHLLKILKKETITAVDKMKNLTFIEKTDDEEFNIP
jgi:hypothetical protein